MTTILLTLGISYGAMVFVLMAWDKFIEGDGKVEKDKRIRE